MLPVLPHKCICTDVMIKTRDVWDVNIATLLITTYSFVSKMHNFSTHINHLNHLQWILWLLCHFYIWHIWFTYLYQIISKHYIRTTLVEWHLFAMWLCWLNENAVVIIRHFSNRSLVTLNFVFNKCYWLFFKWVALRAILAGFSLFSTFRLIS